MNNYTCQCQSGYTGYHCDIEIDECQSSPRIQGKFVFFIFYFLFFFFNLTVQNKRNTNDSNIYVVKSLFSV